MGKGHVHKSRLLSKSTPCAHRSLLVAGAVVALELVVTAQRLHVAEAAQAVCNTRVLIYVYL